MDLEVPCSIQGGGTIGVNGSLVQHRTGALSFCPRVQGIPISRISWYVVLNSTANGYCELKKMPPVAAIDEFDYRTMLCDADVSEMTGWTTSIIRERVEAQKFPQPLNPTAISLWWNMAAVEMWYIEALYSRPTAEEQRKISRDCDLYQSVYESELETAHQDAREQLSGFMEEAIRREAEEQVEAWLAEDIANGVTCPNELHDLWQDHMHDALMDARHDIESEFEQDLAERTELIARWKARQAVLCRK